MKKLNMKLIKLITKYKPYLVLDLTITRIYQLCIKYSKLSKNKTLQKALNMSLLKIGDK